MFFPPFSASQVDTVIIIKPLQIQSTSSTIVGASSEQLTFTANKELLKLSLFYWSVYLVLLAEMQNFLLNPVPGGSFECFFTTTC